MELRSGQKYYQVRTCFFVSGSGDDCITLTLAIDDNADGDYNYNGDAVDDGHDDHIADYNDDDNDDDDDDNDDVDDGDGDNNDNNNNNEDYMMMMMMIMVNIFLKGLHSCYKKDNHKMSPTYNVVVLKKYYRSLQ